MTENKVYTAIGLMSGTSLDGVDCSLIDTDGHGFVRPRGFVSIPYTAPDRDAIRAAFGTKDKADPAIQKTVRIVTLRHAQAVEALMRRMDIGPERVDIIGFHGQTVYHAPKDGVTVQIGDGGLLARETGIAVVDDFRSADVRAGGEGAPLAPLYHAARIWSANVPLPAAVLNIGGVANVTWIGGSEGDILAFDTGPGNALMDDWALRRTGAPYDQDGALAAKGKILPDFLKAWFAHPYFGRVPPKSLDRDQWDIAALGRVADGMGRVSDEDGAATLLAFTTDTIVQSVNHMREPPKAWYACGGGRHNKALMAGLRHKLKAMMLGDLKTVDDLGWDGDATEAECFAYLAVRSLMGLPLSLPTTTGAARPLTGGVLHRGG